jgi:hypothetical protein
MTVSKVFVFHRAEDVMYNFTLCCVFFLVLEKFLFICLGCHGSPSFLSVNTQSAFSRTLSQTCGSVKETGCVSLHVFLKTMCLRVLQQHSDRT